MLGITGYRFADDTIPKKREPITKRTENLPGPLEMGFFEALFGLVSFGTKVHDESKAAWSDPRAGNERT